ncbi:MAG: DUF3999 domain-containing protein [Azonexus sp.]|jgi:hypothetical protein|nr:DUF3999 domain-containing protein [Azonexus sp.]
MKMLLIFPHWAFAALLAAGHFAQAAPAADTPATYAARWPLQLPAGASLVRLPLPVDALTQAQTADLRDLRVFNADGQPTPLALARARPESAAPPVPITLPALPIKTPRQSRVGEFTLHIEDGPNGRIVDLDSKAPGVTTGKAFALLGFLVDTREQKAPLEAIELAAEWPPERPFTFRLATSGDLRNWQPLGDITVYRGADGALLTPPRLALTGLSLQSRYLHIYWDAEAAGISATDLDAVRLDAVRLLPAPPQAAPERLAVPLALAAAAATQNHRDPRVLEWRLPFATPIAALDIRLDGPAALIPVRVLARQQRGQAWTPLARHVVFNLTRDGQNQHSPPLELREAAWREWRLEADPSSPGFTTLPQITAFLDPAQLVFVASGPPPFTLAAGRADAATVYLPLSSLIPDYQPAAENQLAAASLTATAPPPAAALTTLPAAERDPRRWVLWAVLAAGVLALGGMAWALLRQLGKQRTEDG